MAGQMPDRPQPIPKMALPVTSRRSKTDAAGRSGGRIRDLVDQMGVLGRYEQQDKH
jgi:hypothetical protein